MRIRHYRTTAMVLGASLTAWLAGCNDPQSVDLRAQRQESMNWAVESLAKTEAGTHRSRTWALSQMRNHLERDVDNTRKNSDRLGALIQNDFDRWSANQPLYNEAIQRELRGKPQNIGRTAAKMIW